MLSLSFESLHRRIYLSLTLGAKKLLQSIVYTNNRRFPSVSLFVCAHQGQSILAILDECLYVASVKSTAKKVTFRREVSLPHFSFFDTS